MSDDSYKKVFTGKLQLKGVGNGKLLNKKRKSDGTSANGNESDQKHSKSTAAATSTTRPTSSVSHHDDAINKVALKNNDTDVDTTTASSSSAASVHSQSAGDDANGLIDTRTAAERAFDEAVARRQRALIEKRIAKSHRKRIEEFNEKLSKESEHHDIPRIGPG